MKKTLLIAYSLLLFSFVISGCRKSDNSRRSSTFNTTEARQWFYDSFQKSAEWSAYSEETEGIKMPDWKNGIFRKEGNLEVMQFPLLQTRRSIAVPKAENQTEQEAKQIATATITDIFFIKHENGNIEVRETQYIPDLTYLKKKKFAIRDGIEKDFTGQMTVKKWSGPIMSVSTKINNRIVSIARFQNAFPGKSKPPINQKQTTAKSAGSVNGSNKIAYSGADGFDSDCPPTLVCVWEQYCYEYPGVIITEGDDTYWAYAGRTECGDWYNTGECWYVERPCDPPLGECDPRFTACNNEGGNSAGSSNQENGYAALQDIINDLTDPCLIATFNQINTGNAASTAIGTMLQTVFNSSDLINLVIKQSNALLPNQDGNTTATKGTNAITSIVVLNSNTLPKASQEYVAATIYHEIIHAVLNISFKESMLDQHDIMVQYINQMSSTLKNAFPNLSPNDAEALSWGGLQGTAEWQRLSNSDPTKANAILQINQYYKTGVTGTKCK